MTSKTRVFITLLLLGAGTGLRAQIHEELSPLQVDVERFRPQTRAADIYIYEEDTLVLPLKDDFSTNKFRAYNAKPTDPNVTTQQFFHLLDGSSVPFPAGTSFTLTVTNRIKPDTVGTDTTYRTPLPSQNITVNDLSAYPILSATQTVYPCYNIYDSTLINAADVPDTVYLSVCDFVQDSVYVHFVESADENSAIWLDYYAYRNTRFGRRPPTIGVVTFDGLNQNGYPYDFNATVNAVCDKLSSKPIDLSGLTAGDSVFLSFYYQPGGFGDYPETPDSLVVEYLPISGDPTIDADWRHAWAVPGTTTATRFKQVMLHIKDPQFLHSAFRFRFKNYGIPSGSIDLWHVDYVFLDRLRYKNDTISGLNREDVAFQYQATTLLNNRYTSMPLTHFETNPTGFIRDTLKVFKRNNDIGANIVGGLGANVSREGVLLDSYMLTGVVETAPANSNYTTLYHLDTLNFEYDTTGIDSCAAQFDVRFFHNTTPDFIKENDTMYFSQLFSNYYAYDDGTAENAYGPVGASGYDTYLAYKFVLAKPDVLSGIAIHFSPSVENNDNKTFFLTIWDNTGAGGTPGSIIYQETSLYDVVYGNTNNRFHVYPLSSLVNVSGTIYVGWKQTDIDKMNIGFDRNTVNNDRIYYNVGFGWTASAFNGSLLMRPVFNACETTIVNVKEQEEVETNVVTLYPNPARQLVNIGSTLPVEEALVFDLAGQQLMNVSATNVIQLSGLSSGIYLVKVKTKAGFSVHRLVVE